MITPEVVVIAVLLGGACVCGWITFRSSNRGDPYLAWLSVVCGSAMLVAATLLAVLTVHT